MVSTEKGRATAYALENLQERGALFINAGDQVYEGQIVGEHCRDNDLPVNACREKKLTNVRASTAEKGILLKAPRQMTLELALEYIEDDELVEVTPNAVRLRKSHLKEADRRRRTRQQGGEW
jgi:GTP-binding protein